MNTPEPVSYLRRIGDLAAARPHAIAVTFSPIEGAEVDLDWE